MLPAELHSLADLPVMLTVRESAGLLRTTTKAIYQRIRRGKMPGVVKLGRCYLVNRDSLIRAIRKSML
jgi:excisionase family DNA binding protein